MEFKQVDKLAFEVNLGTCMGMGKYTDEGILFFNDTFNTRVVSIDIDLDNMKMRFNVKHDIAYYTDVRVEDTDHTINWMKGDYKVHWKVNAVTLKHNTTKEALKDIRADENIVFDETVVVDYIEKV